MKNFEEYCKDYKNIENYDKALADNFVGWHCHHRRGKLIPTEELKARGMYYNVTADELVFLTASEHSILHNTGNQYRKGKKHTEEAKKKMSEKAKNMSTSHRNKLSEAKKGNTNTKGMHWYHNDVENIMAKKCPEGFVPGMLRKKNVKNFQKCFN